MSSSRTRTVKSSSSRRALRVGVVLGGQLVEERVFAGDLPVRIGQSLRCELSLPVDGVPYEHTLFACDQGQRLLRLTAVMSGRIAHGDALRTELKDGAGDAGIWTLPLAKGVRGRIEIGEATVLFQEVAMPAVTPRPQLPASVRGTLADRVDRRLAVIVGMSLIVHAGVGLWASLTDRVLANAAVAMAPEAYEPSTIIENPTFPDVTPATPDAAASPTPTSQPTPPAIAPPPTTAPTTGGKRLDPIARPRTTMTEAEAARLAQIMTGEGAGSTSTTGGMSRRRPQTDLQNEIDDVRDGNIAVGDDQGGFRKDREDIARGPGPVGPDVPHLEQIPDKVEQPPVVVPMLQPQPARDATTLTPALVLAKIKNHYLGGLQRCYRKGLASDATLSGTLKLTLVVDSDGRISDGEATGLTSEVSSCVEQVMETWRFSPAPKNKRTGEPTEATFELSLAMQPS